LTPPTFAEPRPVITSPALIPAFAAALPEATDATRAPELAPARRAR
jgi:hypothetical protein